MIRSAFYIREGKEIDRRHVPPISEVRKNTSEARASDLRSYPGLWWNRMKQRLYEEK